MKCDADEWLGEGNEGSLDPRIGEVSIYVAMHKGGQCYINKLE